MFGHVFMIQIHFLFNFRDLIKGNKETVQISKELVGMEAISEALPQVGK